MNHACIDLSCRPAATLGCAQRAQFLLRPQLLTHVSPPSADSVFAHFRREPGSRVVEDRV
jgi:hypothetical protein